MTGIGYVEPYEMARIERMLGIGFLDNTYAKNRLC